MTQLYFISKNYYPLFVSIPSYNRKATTIYKKNDTSPAALKSFFEQTNYEKIIAVDNLSTAQDLLKYFPNPIMREDKTQNSKKCLLPC